MITAADIRLQLFLSPLSRSKSFLSCKVRVSNKVISLSKFYAAFGKAPN